MGPLIVTGNVKISMDYVMFHSYTVNIIQGDVILDKRNLTNEDFFLLEYTLLVKPFSITRCLIFR